MESEMLKLGQVFRTVQLHDLSAAPAPLPRRILRTTTRARPGPLYE
jgi:hypothetical protein